MKKVDNWIVYNLRNIFGKFWVKYFCVVIIYFVFVSEIIEIFFLSCCFRVVNFFLNVFVLVFISV